MLSRSFYLVEDQKTDSLDDPQMVQEKGRIEFLVSTGTGLVTRKWKSKSLTIELVTRSKTFYVSTLI